MVTQNNNEINNNETDNIVKIVKLKISIDAFYNMHSLEENKDDVKNFVGSVLEDNNVYATSIKVEEI